MTNQLWKKWQNHNISPILGEAPAEWIEMKTCTGVDIGDIIMDVKFKFEEFRGFWCHWWSKFAISTLHVDLTAVKRYRGACDRITSK